MDRLDDLLARLWNDYRRRNPQVDRIHRLLTGRGETVVNDHIALRTFGDERLGLKVLGDRFERLGYRRVEDYHFDAKKLRASHYEHADAGRPKVFISELELDRCSGVLREAVAGVVDQADEATLSRWDLPAVGRPWAVSRRTYEQLAAESEYAAWVAAFGFCANHFTVLVNALKTFDDLPSLNAFLKANGFALNDSGGEIKGSPQTMLEQSSTLADVVSVQFSDGQFDAPCCYYEFARRYPTRDGSLFAGFVAKSADKIFESTDNR